MQTDFHHAATYVIARLAGFTHHEAVVIAYASQYVSDCKNKGMIRFDNGSVYQSTASSRRAFDWDTHSICPDYYETWLPFHYLPGNNGEGEDASQSAPIAQRLACIPDSPISDEMWRDCAKRIGDSNCLHRLGIASHVYCDSFACQMFVGVKHPTNHIVKLEQKCIQHDPCVVRSAYIPAEAIDGGHDGAHGLPDLPYAKWKAIILTGRERSQDNTKVYHVACKRLFRQYLHYLGRDPNIAISARDLAVIDKLICSETSGDESFRHSVWLTSIKIGLFSFGTLSEDECSELEYIPSGPGSWEHEALGENRRQAIWGSVLKYGHEFEDSDWKKFQDALKSHQKIILEQVFPKYRLPRSGDEARSMGL